MIGIEIKSKGNFSKTENFLSDLKKIQLKAILDKYGKRGVDALEKATPVDSGKTASSWYYKIDSDKDRSTITWCNSNINKGVMIAIILQYGHGTGTGGYVQGIDYINPAMKPIFDEITEKVWGEVTKL